MIISRTPVRVSFCGGGTDLPAYYLNSENGGLVTSFALSKHIHVTVNKRFDDSVRVSYSRTEIVDDFENIEHELVREAMRMTGVTSGIEITKKNILIYSILLLPVALSPFYLKFLGLIYLLFSLPLSTYYIFICFKLFRAKDAKSEKIIAKQIFAFSILYLFAIFISILVDKFA